MEESKNQCSCYVVMLSQILYIIGWHHGFIVQCVGLTGDTRLFVADWTRLVTGWLAPVIIFYDMITYTETTDLKFNLWSIILNSAD